MFKQKLGIISILGTSLPLLLLTGNNAVAANLIQNGSFEIGPNPGSFLTLGNGSTAIDNWVVTEDNIDYVGTFWQSSDGNRSLDLGGFQAGAIAQTFNTTVGQNYLVTFDLAGNTEGSPTIKTMRVEAAGQFADFTFDVTGKDGSNMGWTPQSWEFTATDAQTTLEFKGLDDTNAGPALDNVAVTAEDTVVPEPEPIPEPITILGSLTVLGFGTLMKRQKAK